MVFKKLEIIISQFFHFFYLYIKDLFYYYKNKEYEIFKGFGLHIYTGMFGSGKTSAMVKDAYDCAVNYKTLTILTNMKLMNFPEHTNIIELQHYSQIIEAPKDTLILIDEISTVFNSRDWKYDGIPASLLGMLLQVRKQHKMLFATAQRFNHVDSLIRQITFTVRECKCICGRWNIIKYYDGLDYEYQNSIKPPKLLKIKAFIQTNKIRSLYDTEEMVEKMKKQRYINDIEVIEKQSGKVANIRRL